MFRIIFGILRDKNSKRNEKEPHATRLPACTILGKRMNCAITTHKRKHDAPFCATLCHSPTPRSRANRLTAEILRILRSKIIFLTFLMFSDWNNFLYVSSFNGANRLMWYHNCIVTKEDIWCSFYNFKYFISITICWQKARNKKRFLLA